ncbi:MAG: EAL domain-containing protein [Gallionella sp.]|nr:EAL domain-containing protein [Gallionella sp.]
MTLFKQLFWSTTIAFTIIQGATEAIYIRNAHKYLQEQLASHAQDTATSLGLVLPAAMAENDMVRAEVTVNALFDRGYYQSIRVLDSRGQTVVLKSLPPMPDEMPKWLVKLLPLEMPSAESLISKDWRQLGRVVVSSHPNFAYKQLWRSLVEVTMGLTLLYILTLVLLHRFLTRILKPLRAIEDVANAISARDFQQISPVPRTRELHNVVNAINSMSNKLHEIIEHEVLQAIRFRNESSQDVLTGLKNRRGFEAYVESLLKDSRDLSSGAIFMLQIADLRGFNIRHGYHQGDVLLQNISVALQSVWEEKDMLRSRINGATFVLMAANLSREESIQLGDALLRQVAMAVDSLQNEAPMNFGCGAVYFSGQAVTQNSLLVQCDMAMLQSLSNGNRLCVLQNLMEDDHSKGSQYWKHLILDAIAAQRFTLMAQPVMNIRNQTQFQTEIVGWLKQENGEPVPAEQFIPMANRHHLTPAFDLAILKRLFGRMASGVITDKQVAFNLSTYSIHDVEFLHWLYDALRADPLLARRLVFEFTEFGLVQDMEGVQEFVVKIRELGAKFAVDNFGLHHSAFEYLQQLKPSYLKLSQAYFRDLRVQRENQFFISSVVNIAQSLDIRVIALGIENVDALELLSNLGVDGYQGFVTGGLEELY